MFSNQKQMWIHLIAGGLITVEGCIYGLIEGDLERLDEYGRVIPRPHNKQIRFYKQASKYTPLKRNWYDDLGDGVWCHVSDSLKDELEPLFLRKIVQTELQDDGHVYFYDDFNTDWKYAAPASEYEKQQYFK